MSPDQLRRWRHVHRLSVRRAAGLVGVAPRSWHRWEAGTREIPHWLRLTLPVISQLLVAAKLRAEHHQTRGATHDRAQ